MIKLSLPMTYTVLAYAKRGDREYVLCYLPDNHATPYAMWRLGAPDTHTGNGGRACGNGDYCRDENEAWMSFTRRAELNPLKFT